MPSSHPSLGLSVFFLSFSPGKISFCKGLPGRVAAQISRCARLRASSRCARLRRRARGPPGRTPPPSGSAACRALPWQLSNSIALVHAHDTHHTVFSHRRQLRQHTWRPRTNPCQPFEFTGSRGFPVNTHTWSTWSAVSNRTSRAGELRSAPSGPDDWHRVAGKRALAQGVRVRRERAVK